MRCLVTGSSGFIGGYLVARLRELGYRVVGAGRARWRCEADVVFHLATHYQREHCLEDVVPMVDANYRCGAYWLDMCREYGEKFIYTDSYFSDDPKTLYGFQKKQFGDLVRFYGSNYGVKYHIVKVFNTFGDGDGRDLLLSKLYRGEAVDIKNPDVELPVSHVRGVVDHLIGTIGAGVVESEVPHQTLKAGEINRGVLLAKFCSFS